MTNSTTLPNHGPNTDPGHTPAGLTPRPHPAYYLPFIILPAPWYWANGARLPLDPRA